MKRSVLARSLTFASVLASTLAVTALTARSAQAAMTCADLLGGPAPSAKVAKLIDRAAKGVKNAPLEQMEMYEEVAQILNRRPDLKAALGLKNYRAALEIFADERRELEHFTINYIITEAARYRKGTPEERIDRAILESLKADSPMASNQELVAAFREGRVSFEKVIGNFSAREMTARMIGTGGPRNVDPNSLVGQFLAEAARIKRRPISTDVRRLSVDANTRRAAPERLVIALDAVTFPIWQKYFDRPNFLTHVHTNSQGTLMLGYNSEVFYYTGKRDMRAPGTDTLMPTLLLSTSEANRVHLFFKMFADGTRRQIAQWPWTLTNESGDRYCAIGGYNSCTHWFGSIPMGDQPVREWMFPGAVDQYASNNIPGPNNRAPRRQAIGSHRNTDPLVNAVYPANEAPMQLWQVLGLEREQQWGELANPGYVANSVLTRVSAERVPVVFFMQENSTAPIRQDLESTIRAY